MMKTRCSRHEPDPNRPPRVAHCVSGLVRSFTTPLVYKALRENLIERFGGESSIFFVLKTFDVPSKDRNGIFNLTASSDMAVDWTAERIDRQIRPAIEWLRPAGVQLRNSSHETPRMINSVCPTATSSEVKRHPHHLIYASEAGMVRLVGQMQSNAECLRLIVEYEERNGVCFDWVSRGRPDLLHMGGGERGTVPRYNSSLLFDHNRTRDTVFMDTRDWFVLTRRPNAKGALDVLDFYRRCNRSRPDLRTPESWLRASIRSEGANYRTLDLPVALAHPESCAEVCPRSAQLERIEDAIGNGANMSHVTAFRVRKYGCSVATPEACVDDVPLTCRNPGCSQALVRLVGERRVHQRGSTR